MPLILQTIQILFITIFQWSVIAGEKFAKMKLNPRLLHLIGIHVSPQAKTSSFITDLENQETVFLETMDHGHQAALKGNLPKAEECYTKALASVQFTKDPQKILLCMKNLAAIYHRDRSLKQRKKRLIQAAGMYNYCLRIARFALPTL